MESQTYTATSFADKSFGHLVSTVAWVMAAFHIYTGIFGIFESVLQRSVHVEFAMVLVFLMTNVKGKKRVGLPPWYDWVIIGLIAAIVGYVVVNAGDIASRYSYVTPLSQYEVIAGCIGMLLQAKHGIGTSRYSDGLSGLCLCRAPSTGDSKPSGIFAHVGGGPNLFYH